MSVYEKEFARSAGALASSCAFIALQQQRICDFDRAGRDTKLARDFLSALNGFHEAHEKHHRALKKSLGLWPQDLPASLVSSTIRS